MRRSGIWAVGLLVVMVLASTANAAPTCRTALLVIDMQANLLAFGGSRLQTVYGQPILERVESVVDLVRDAGLPMIYAKFVNGDLQTNADHFHFCESIAPAGSDTVIARTDPDVFADPALHDLLQEEGITQLLICGLYSTCCVNTAVLRGAELGYSIVVIKDGHGDYQANRSAAIEAQAHWVSMENVRAVKLADIDLGSLCHP
ncbi:cysteine hydrolase [Candidatus Bipolaricaulota bacterium]|nr:cysteine hydrolase [Candidatus Bipolaricaulota bacterium]TFH11623.1 MAG: cysteine hydrolase [Candidatus Atribacteria bacterium]